jgi:hypothetical protein
MATEGSRAHTRARRTGRLAPAILVALAVLAPLPGRALEQPARELDRTLARGFVSQLDRSARPAETALGMVVHLRAEVAALDYGAGILTLDVNGRPYHLRATPDQLADLVPGEIVQLRFGVLGDQRWVLLDEKLPPGRLESFGRYSKARGIVNSVDKARGLVVLAGRVHHCHPSMLQGVLPGQVLEIEFVRVEGRRWIRSLCATA